jgi:carbon storage regulator
MLVLSRRLSEKILLPSINVTVQVVAIRPGQVRLGIDAPPDVQVLRAEIAHQYPLEHPEPVPVEVRTELADHLQAADAGVRLLRHQLQAGLTEDAYATLDRLNQELAALHRVAGSAGVQDSRPKAMPLLAPNPTACCRAATA